MMDYATASQDELQAEFVRLGILLSETANARQDILAETDRRRAAAKAVLSVGGLSAAEREALRNELLGGA